jgi:hypothetical protein
MKIALPCADRGIETYALSSAEPLPAKGPISFNKRVAYAAAHVVVDPIASAEPTTDCCLDFEATLAYRRHLWSLGFSVAEVMDTAQRGMGLGWDCARDLIRLTCQEAGALQVVAACGANTDSLPANTSPRLDEIVGAYEEQCDFIEKSGGQVIVMASRHLARSAQGAHDYLSVYRKILSGRSRPVILHWLGEAFDPSLAGYWGSTDVSSAMDTVVALVHECRTAVDGIKISLLDKDKEIEMRRRLPGGVRMYTGDDFHYPELIEGDEQGFSHALLGIFDAIAPAAALAFQKLDEGDITGYRELLSPTLPLSRHIFKKPTYLYKTGIVFLAYLNGFQNHFRMLGAQEGARSIVHLAELFRFADKARLLANPELAVQRFRPVLSLAGLS